MPKLSSVLTFLAVVCLAWPATSSAAERRAKPETKKVKALGEWAYKRLNETHELLGAEKYTAALAVLKEMSERKRLNDHERALMWQTYAYVYSSQENYQKAADSFEKCLATNGLPDQSQISARYNLAQLYLALQNYPKAIENFSLWFEQADNPSPHAHFVLAMAYVQNKQEAKALPHAEQAVAKAPAPKEPWLQLLLALYFEGKQYAKAADVLKQLVQRFPKKAYYLQLSAVYSELDERKKALAAIELVYLQGLLNRDGEYRTLAQLYLYNEIPYKAGRVLEEGLASGVIESDTAAWALLADSWLHARERDRALGPLEKAAELSDDGKLYVRLGQVQLDEERWAEARRALTAGLRKGRLKDTGNVHFLLGVANASEKRWEEAESSFLAAQKYEDSKTSATKWLEHLATQRAQEEAELAKAEAEAEEKAALAEEEAEGPAEEEAQKDAAVVDEAEGQDAEANPPQIAPNA